MSAYSEAIKSGNFKMRLFCAGYPIAKSCKKLPKTAYDGDFVEISDVFYVFDRDRWIRCFGDEK